MCYRGLFCFLALALSVILSGCRKRTLISEEEKSCYDSVVVTTDKNIQKKALSVGCIILPGAQAFSCFSHETLSGCCYQISTPQPISSFATLIAELLESEGWLVAQTYESQDGSTRLIAEKPSAQALYTFTSLEKSILICCTILHQEMTGI